VRFPDGKRQITEVLLPGEFASCDELVGSGSSPRLVGLSDIEICLFDRTDFLNALQNNTSSMALWKSCAGQARRLREWLATLGKQSAEARTAALMLHVYRRLTTLGYIRDDEMPFPLRQQDLADILGLTQVHVSRMLKLLKDKRLLSFAEGRIRLLDLPALTRIAQTCPS
jgi:CRP-like cAMP-binding protein